MNDQYWKQHKPEDGDGCSDNVFSFFMWLAIGAIVSGIAAAVAFSVAREAGEMITITEAIMRGVTFTAIFAFFVAAPSLLTRD